MLVTTLGYLEEQGKILMLHRIRKKNDINQDKWIGIGGKLEDGETVLACMQRECREETGLIWKNPELRAVITFNFRKHEDDPLFSELMFLFCGGEYEDGGEARDDEGDLVWVSWQDLTSLNLWKGDLLFLKKLRDHDPFFFMELSYIGNDLIHASINEEEIDLSDESLFL